MSTEPNLKAFLNETKERSKSILESSHIGADVKGIIKDLIALGDNVVALLNQNRDQTADTRVLRKKLDQSRAEAKVLEQKSAEIRSTILSFTEDIKTIAAEANQIIKRSPGSADATSASKILSSTQSMVQSIVELSSGQ
jgi:hypothetical protein